MPDSLFTLADMAIVNDRNMADIDVSDLFQGAPLVRILNATKASNGTVHKYYKTTQAPEVGFRAWNDGRAHDSAYREAVTLDLKILDASFTFGKDEAESYYAGAEAVLRMEAIEHMKAAYFKLEYQVINGTKNNGVATGFTGFADAKNLTGKCINATGTTALSSVYLIRNTINDVSLVTNTGLLEVGETIVQRADGATTGHMPVYFTPISGWYGVQIGSEVKSLARICNLDATTKGLTDALLYDAISSFEAGMGPTHIIMNRRSLSQLRKSRTATNATGAPAPIPTEVEGIPIIVTDAISNSETAVAAT